TLRINISQALKTFLIKKECPKWTKLQAKPRASRQSPEAFPPYTGQQMHALRGKLPLVPWGCIEAPSGASKLFFKNPRVPGGVRTEFKLITNLSRASPLR